MFSLGVFDDDFRIRCVGAYAGNALHTGGLVRICLGHCYDLAVRRLEPEPRLAANIEVDLVLWMPEDLVALDGLVLDRCGAVGADALDSDLRFGDGVAFGHPLVEVAFCHRPAFGVHAGYELDPPRGGLDPRCLEVGMSSY